MRFYVVFLLLSTTLCYGFSEDEEMHKEIVTKTIQLVTDEYEKALLNATIFGQQSSKKRGTKTTPESEEIGKISHIQKAAFDILTEQHNLDKPTALRHIRQALPQACQQSNFGSCQANLKFRSQDGTCNNLNQPRWGSAPSPLVRVANPAYNDGADVPRGGRQTSRLPNPRVVSKTVHPDSIITNPFITNMVPQYGQFLDHDMSLTPENNRMCCTGQNDPDCWPIPIPTNDVFYSSLNPRQTCMDFTRSTPWCFATTGVREQINVNTAFIDGSQIYGSTAQRTQSLRQFQAGRLRTNTNGLNGFLPSGQSVGVQVQGNFVAGDDRINENPALAVMHNVFLMEHNRVAAELARLAPSWNEERVFQETRRIMGAQLQQITYNEYLPIVLGNDAMQEYGLTLGNSYSTYDPSVNPSIINSFATAAYRFGHSLINGLYRLVNPTSNQQVGTYQVRDNYFQSTQITQSNGQGYDWILRGLMTQNSQEFDPFVTDDVTNFLFKPQNQNFGSDLVARNLQRGRDHGLPGYNVYRNICGLQSITSWAQRPAEIRSDAWTRVQNLYSSLGLTPSDIDLFTGGLIETPVNGGLTGPTFNCIKSTQFARLKFGDRFFFTHGNTAGTFTAAQLSELRRRTLGDIICQNSQQPSTTRNVFLVPSSTNAFISCTDASRSRLNLSVFAV